MRKLYKSTGIKRFDHAISSLDNHLSISGKSISTRKSYNSYLYRFILFSNKLPDECTKNEIVNLILNLQTERGFQSAILKFFVYSIRYYLKNIVERMDLFTKIPIPRTKHYDIEVLNINEVISLFDHCKNNRDRLILQLLYETGIRINELINLNFQDFDLYNNTLTIRNSKNNKTRTVYFGNNIIKLVQIYHNSNKSLFSNSPSNMQFHPFFSLSRSGIRFMMQSVVKRSGINKRVTPHLLRHAFAVHYLNFGGTIYQLQKLLGHNHLTTTFHYLQYAVLPESKNISILDKVVKIKHSNNFIILRA